MAAAPYRPADPGGPNGVSETVLSQPILTDRGNLDKRFGSVKSGSLGKPNGATGTVRQAKQGKSSHPADPADRGEYPVILTGPRGICRPGADL
jgi:hypothetical protein